MFRTLSAFALLTLLVVPAWAQGPWVATQLGTLGGATSSASDVNDAGQVVGTSQTAGGFNHAFIWTLAGGMVDLGTLGGNTSSASAINNVGQVVGSSTTAAGQNHAFLWSASTGMVDLGTPGGTSSSASGINDAGTVSVSGLNASGFFRAYQWTASGGFVDIGTLGGGSGLGMSTGSSAINNAGWIIGSSPAASACTNATICNGWPHAFLWKPGIGMSDLGFLGSRNTEGNALGLNNLGQVVGYIEHAFVISGNAAFSWTPASGMVRVSTLGGMENTARDVNDSGLIVGSSFLAGDLIQHAFAGKIGSAMADLALVAGGTSSSAAAVNNLGVIVGTAASVAGPVRAVIWYPAAPTITMHPMDLGVTPGATAAFTAAASGTPTPIVQWQVSTNGGAAFVNISGATAATHSFIASAADSGKKFRAIFTNSHGSATSTAASLTVSTTLPTMSLDKASLIMSAVRTGTVFGARTSPQIVRLTQTGPGTVTWTAVSTTPWLHVFPASGNGSATLRIATQFATGLSPSQAGAVTLTFVGASNTAGPIAVTLLVLAAGTGAAPAGSFDTPLEGTTGVTGSIAVTGWAMDDVEVTAVRILRNPVAGEPAGELIPIGNASLVEGARPDVAALFPTAPRNTRAGWGYLMLTNFLPGLGNGTFTLHAIADDADGHSTLLGSRTITCTNSTATAPFGAIDTPSQGGLVGGTLNNFGWVLAPAPRRADPPSGGTVQVVIDGVVLGSVPSGWTTRSDLTALFPALQFPGITNALGVATIDSASLTNGVHTIAWIVTDNLGVASGIGSRYFTVSNGVSQTLAPVAEAPSIHAYSGGRVEGRHGPDVTAPFEPLETDTRGVRIMQAEELERIELRVRASAGYLRSALGNQRLPIGSRIDPVDGSFTWQPGPGFVGSYDLVFDTPEGRREVRVVLNPQGRLTRPQVVIDAPSPGREVSDAFTVAGWALDPASRHGTGISSIHLWAYPVGNGDPIFLGTATLGGRRPDVESIYGARFEASGFGLVASGLRPGAYDVAVFAWSDAGGLFLPARVVRVIVR